MGKVTAFTRPPVRVRIDLNARTAEGYVPARKAWADGLLVEGDQVVVFEPDDEVKAPARVAKILGDFVYLDVAWADMTDDAVVPVVTSMQVSPAHGQRTGSLSSWLRIKVAGPAIVGAATLVALSSPITQQSPAAVHTVEAKDVHPA